MTFVPSGTEALNAAIYNLDMDVNGVGTEGAGAGAGAGYADVVEEQISSDLEGDDCSLNEVVLDAPSEFSSLLSLLDNGIEAHDGDVGSNVPVAPPREVATSVEKNRLLALFEDDGDGDGDTDESRPENMRKPKVNLMDLLDDDYDYEIDNASDKVEPTGTVSNDGAGQGGVSKKKMSLLDLLDDDFFDSEDTFSSPEAEGTSRSIVGSREQDGFDSLQRNATSGDNASLLNLLSGADEKSSEGSLLDLLGEDGSSSSSSSMGQIGVHKKPSERSLLDLLDEEDSVNPDRADSKPSAGSLLDLLHEGDAAQKVASSTPQRSLLDLLDDDDIMDEYQSRDDKPSRSLMDILNDDDFGVSEAVASDEVEVEDAVEAYSLRDAMMRVQSLTSSMRKRDWKLLNQNGGMNDKDDELKEVTDDEGKIISDLSDGSFDSTDDNADDDSDDEGGNRGDELVDELLLGSSMNKWALSSDEFNVLLLHVATSTESEKIAKLLDIYLHMKELEASGHSDAGPNSNTYAILLDVLDRTPGASAIAADVCKQMMDRVTDDFESAGESAADDEETEKFMMSEETLSIAMRIHTKRLDIEGAESLMKLALSDSGGGIRVSPQAFKMLLLLYKSSNQQDKAVELIRTCLEVRDCTAPEQYHL